MIVLAWQSYGNVRVHRATTIGDLTEILAKVQAETAIWAVDQQFYRLAQNVVHFAEVKGDLERARREIAAFAQRHSDTELFETFQFTELEG
jgi:hypothetical protein